MRQLINLAQAVARCPCRVLAWNATLSERVQCTSTGPGTNDACAVGPLPVTVDSRDCTHALRTTPSQDGNANAAVDSRPLVMTKPPALRRAGCLEEAVRLKGRWLRHQRAESSAKRTVAKVARL